MKPIYQFLSLSGGLVFGMGNKGLRTVLIIYYIGLSQAVHPGAEAFNKKHLMVYGEVVHQLPPLLDNCHSGFKEAEK